MKIIYLAFWKSNINLFNHGFKLTNHLIKNRKDFNQKRKENNWMDQMKVSYVHVVLLSVQVNGGMGINI